ncbi:MAG TPA: glycosyltransferase family 1 protein [Thermoanaerobaculia bacterium]|nr:glycosyltransferase family 1 protein [Thermoanaerobaculia bacterium]
MRIGIDIGKALGALDGIGRYTRGLLVGLGELEASLPAAERVEYRLYPLFRCDVVVERESLLPPGARGFSFAERAAPVPGEVDLFHATAWAVPAAWRGPLALTLYDLTFLTLPATHTAENRAHCSVGLARALARGGALCAISESVGAEARALGVAEERVALAPPGVDARFAPQSAEAIERACRELGVEGSYVLSIGTHEPRKNLAGLLEAWRLLPEALRGRHRLVLAGAAGWAGAPGEEPLARAVERLGLDAEVRRLGAVADRLLPGLYAGASAFVYPSLGEGFGLPPLEAMACGVPVVASDRPAIPEAVGDAAELCDPTSPQRLAAAIARVLDDPERAEEMRVAGRERARRFTWRATAEALRAAWSGALEAPDTGGARCAT